MSRGHLVEQNHQTMVCHRDRVFLCYCEKFAESDLIGEGEEGGEVRLEMGAVDAGSEYWPAQSILDKLNFFG